MSAQGGITEGKSHKEGGIPMVVKSTGQHVELEGGEGVINKRNMASEKTFEFEGEEKTICEIASEINSTDGNGVKIDCDNVTGKKYKYKEGGNILSEEEEADFDAWFEDGNVEEVEDGVYATQDYQWNNRIKGKEELKKFYAKEYLDRRYAEGGGVEDYQSLIGKYVNIYSMGVSLPTQNQIKEVMVSGENFRYRYITLKFDIGIAPIPFNEGNAFMENQIIFVNDNKEEYGIQLIPNQYAKGGRMPNTLKLEDYETASMSMGGYEEQMIVPQSTTGMYKEGGDVPKASKMFHLPLELAVYVPSTQDVDEVISEGELNARVNEVSKYLASTFGGFTKSERVGGFMTSKSELVTEDVVPVVSFATKEDYEANKEKLVEKLSEWARKWGQEAIGFEFEGDLYYVPQKFDKGGDVRDFDWYQGFKKKQLKKGTEHEMEHIDTIRDFKKEGVSDREVAEAIAKDHLEEDENYYIELEKMESSRKVSEALGEFKKNKTRKKNIRKFNVGGFMGGSEGEMIYVKMKEDVTTDLFTLSGDYFSDSTFRKDSVNLMNFISNNGYSSKLELYKSGVYVDLPNKAFEVVGYDSSKYGKGGDVKAQFDSLLLSPNDKKIMEVLRSLNEENATHQQREMISQFRGNNVVNELTNQMISKIYGLLFQWHNLDNPIHNIVIQNAGAGNLVSLVPANLMHNVYISFDESNLFNSVESKICGIVNTTIKLSELNDYAMKSVDAIVKVYAEGNPKYDTLIGDLYKSDKRAIIVGVAEFSTLKHLEEFKVTIAQNLGGLAMNQMLIPKSTHYVVINDGISDEANYTLIYGVTKI